MALTFGAAVSDRVVVTAAASINDLDPCTWMQWVYPTTLTDARYLFRKGTATAKKEIALNGTGGNLAVVVNRATTNTSYITSNTPLATLNKWYFVACTYDSAAAAGQIVNIYVGDLSTAVAEATYGTATDGTGATSADNTGNLFIGNRASPGNVAFEGRIGHFSYYNVALTSAQVEAQRLRQFAATGCVVFMQLGFDGTGTQIDLSGNANNGTVTGATLSAHHPYVVPAYSALCTQTGILKTGSSIGAIA